MEDDHKIYELIENERRERRQDIGEIHNRIDQILEAINKIGKNGNGSKAEASWVRQTVGLITLGIVLIGSMTTIVLAIVNPIQLQIEYLKRDSSAVEKRAEMFAQLVDRNLQSEIETIRRSAYLESERAKSRLEKLEDWGDWWHKSLLIKDINERERIIE